MNMQQDGRILYPVAEIGTWTAGMWAGGTVEEASRAGDFWELSWTSREELAASLAGGVGAVPVHELIAVVDPGLGDVVVADGCHLYAAARDHGIDRLPVRWGRWDDWFGDA